MERLFDYLIRIEPSKMILILSPFLSGESFSPIPTDSK
jgi:hypothetical protein